MTYEFLYAFVKEVPEKMLLELINSACSRLREEQALRKHERSRKVRMERATLERFNMKGYLQAIKYHREHFTMDLKASKDYVDGLVDKHNLDKHHKPVEQQVNE